MCWSQTRQRQWARPLTASRFRCNLQHIRIAYWKASEIQRPDQPRGQRLRFQLLRILHLDITPLDSTEGTPPPNLGKMRALVQWAAPNPATRIALVSLRFKISTADSFLVSTSGSSRTQTHPGPHPRLATLASRPRAPAVRVDQRSTSCSPRSGPLAPRRSGSIPSPRTLISPPHLPAPTPPTSNCSACPSHRPLNRRLWLPRFLVSFFPSLPGLQSPSSSMLLSSPLFSHLSLRVSSSLLPAARLLQTPIPTPVSPYDSFSQHPCSPASCILASQAPRTAASLLTFLGGPGPPWSQKQGETERHQADEQAQRMWADAGLHGPQTGLSVRRRLEPRQPQHR